MNDEPETITIICYDEDCHEPYMLSLDTLRAAKKVTIHCARCGEIQHVVLTERGGIELYPESTASIIRNMG